MKTLTCVNCDKDFNPVYEDYTVGVSLGEYWCKTCAIEERKKYVEGLNK